MINYIDFLANEINIMSLTHVIYGNLLLSGHPKAVRLIHPSKKLFHTLYMEFGMLH